MAISKEGFIVLAKAAVEQSKYERELWHQIIDVAKKHGQDTDFIGLDINTNKIADAICQILGDNFGYFLYECEASFDIMNENITLPDGKHPEIKSYEDLYEFCKGECK